MNKTKLIRAESFIQNNKHKIYKIIIIIIRLNKKTIYEKINEKYYFN